MILHLSKWIGEKSLADENIVSALDEELRNIKRALVVSFMEQMCRAYADDSPCDHNQVDCDCFYRTNNYIVNRMSEIQKMAARLFYGSSNNGSNSDIRTNMRMREIRLYWLASEDEVIIRNAHLLHKKSITWAADADNALRKLAGILHLNAVQTVSDEETSENNDFEDPSDVNDMVAGFAGINTQSQSDHFQYQAATIETEIENFLRQSPAHFSKCKLIFSKKDTFAPFADKTLSSRFNFQFVPITKLHSPHEIIYPRKRHLNLWDPRSKNTGQLNSTKTHFQS